MFLDVPTRWNSTYMMLITTLEFRQVFPRYSDRDQNFIWAPTHEEWEKVENVCEVLEIFNDVTNIISEVWRVKTFWLRRLGMRMII